MFFMEKVILPVKAFFRYISHVFKLVLECIISIVCQFFLSFDIYSKEKECSAGEDLSHEQSNVENIEKERNHSDEALQREEKQEV